MLKSSPAVALAVAVAEVDADDAAASDLSAVRLQRVALEKQLHQPLRTKAWLVRFPVFGKQLLLQEYQHE